MTQRIELIDWSERFPHETSLQIAIRQSTFCTCGAAKQIGVLHENHGQAPDIVPVDAQRNL